jgi:hypothetical protein
MADLSGGPDSYEASVDDWKNNIENYFPNYYTRKEKESPYLAMIPFYIKQLSAPTSNYAKNYIVKIKSHVVNEFTISSQKGKEYLTETLKKAYKIIINYKILI